MQFLISLVLAFLSGMGVGGGGLFALYLKFFQSLGQIEVQTLNLIFFLFAAGAALAVHLLKRRIYFLPVCIMIGSGVVGSLLGSGIALSINSDILGKIFGAMLIFTGVFTLFRKKKQ